MADKQKCMVADKQRVRALCVITKPLASCSRCFGERVVRVGGLEPATKLSILRAQLPETIRQYIRISFLGARRCGSRRKWRTYHEAQCLYRCGDFHAGCGSRSRFADA